MAKSTLTQAEVEALTLKKEDQAARAEIDPTNRDNFNIVRGKPLPPEFENPPLGNPGHLCLDLLGKYQPKWSQIVIQKVHEGQEDPQPFPLGRTIKVPLAEWCDVPPEVVNSLENAVEDHHEHNATPEQITLGIHPEHKVTTIPRFFWNRYPSA